MTNALVKTEHKNNFL